MEKEINEKKEFSQRLVQALLSKGYQSKHASSGVAIRELSIATGISMEMARRYTLGLALPKSNIIKIIADWLDVNPLWLRDGISISDTPQIIQLPLISWQQINHWQTGEKSEKTHKLQTILPITPQAFAVETLSDLTPVLRQGTVLIIEPNKKATHKSLVLTATHSNEPAELKQFWIDNDTSYLKSLDHDNQQAMTSQTIIKGVFISADFVPFSC